jgi:hypothetical protein
MMPQYALYNPDKQRWVGKSISDADRRSPRYWSRAYHLCYRASDAFFYGGWDKNEQREWRETALRLLKTIQVQEFPAASAEPVSLYDFVLQHCDPTWDLYHISGAELLDICQKEG